jgi:hypothetical protein
MAGVLRRNLGVRIVEQRMGEIGRAKARGKGAGCVGESELHVSQGPDGDPDGFGLAEAQAGVPETNLNRIAKRSACDEFHQLAFNQAQLIEALDQPRLAREGEDFGPLAGLELIECRHQLAA